jgi:lipoprotein-anchoring transpeptidase ErfK/SrfK
MAGGLVSGRRRRPLAVLVAFVALASPACAAATRRAPVVAPAQELVTLLGPHVARSQPSARGVALALVPAATPITGERTMLPVLTRDGQWLEVRLPGRPNGHTGWIRREATARLVTAWHLVVDPARRQVSVYRAGRLQRVLSAVVGKPSTPTPPGQFFVEESVALRPVDPGAPFALALSARSNVLQEFDGGPGQIAIHGIANIGGVPGTAASHGCIRLTTAAIRWLVALVGPGTPVTITG